MMELCPYCGGLLKENGKGYKCKSCSSVFDSKKEIEQYKPQKKSPLSQVNKLSNTSVSSQINISIESSQSLSPPQNKTFNSDCGSRVFDQNINSVLEITWRDGAYKHSGSGFLINKDGYAITNTHVVTYEDGKSCGTVNVKLCDKNISADVVRLGDDFHGNGTGVDLALIKLKTVPSDANVVQFEDFDNVRNGERVFVIGNSLGYGSCITSGIVSDKTRKVNGKMLLMTDCAVNNGNSGGPIFNEKGFMIGAIVSGITTAKGMNFAIPVDIVKKFIQ